jgi:hypothetical protein
VGCGPFRPGARFVHLKIAATKLFSIKASDRLGRFFIIGHFDESKPAGSASLTIHRNMDSCNLSRPFEQRGQVTFRRLEA